MKGRILMKTISKKFHGLYVKKNRYFLKFYVGNQNMFVNACKGVIFKLFFYLFNDAAKKISIIWVWNFKEEWNQASFSIGNIFLCTWHILYKLHKWSCMVPCVQVLVLQTSVWKLGCFSKSILKLEKRLLRMRNSPKFRNFQTFSRIWVFPDPYFPIYGTFEYR